MLRTRLLRSLARGKPALASVGAQTGGRGAHNAANAIVMYNSQLVTTVNHIHGVFGKQLNRRDPRFIHGADDSGASSTSDPSAARIDNWGLLDRHGFFQFTDRFSGDAQWGLGSGEIIGCPNSMDISQPYGMVYGEGLPSGGVYYRSVDEQRGRFLLDPSESRNPDLGVPQVTTADKCICSVWIAKSDSVMTLSNGLVGMLCGASNGVLTAYSLGTDGIRGRRLAKGEITAQWVLSPGVPIVGIAVDDNYSLRRSSQNRIWAVVLNALGELYYLTQMPKQSSIHGGRKVNEEALTSLAWATGRTVYWNLVEPSRRHARPNPYGDDRVDGSYSPRTSWDGMCLSRDQIRSETLEIESFLTKQPKEFQRACYGWDMRRRLEVDFAGDDGQYAGEAIVVFSCGLDEGQPTGIQRFVRWKVSQMSLYTTVKQPGQSTIQQPHSLFGGSDTGTEDARPREYPTFGRSFSESPERDMLVEEWRCSTFDLGGLKNIQISTTCVDLSTYAVLTMSEDPLLNFSASNTSSPISSPVSSVTQLAAPSDIPGQRSRLIAAGTTTGVVLVWDIRASIPRSAEFSNAIDPVRVIYTESPEISSLALTALYLVHGGNDGLVQAWDPLGSSMQPIRTLNSRFSSRARRRLVQAQASPQGVGINLFAAGAICLDPDPTSLRGMVSLGTHLRYWSYSSSAADQYRSQKRRMRRSERSGNAGGDHFASTRSGGIKSYIAHEQYEHTREIEHRRRKAEHLDRRFGTALLGDDDEALAYAAMLSQETLADEERRRQGEASQTAASTASASSLDRTPSPDLALKPDDELEAEIARAIELSLLESSSNSATPTPAPTPPVSTAVEEGTFDVPIKYKPVRRRTPPRGQISPPKSQSIQGEAASVSGAASVAKDQEESDLEFAMHLSLAEKASQEEAKGGAASDAVAEEGFPLLSRRSEASNEKGKGKGRA